MRFFWAHEMVTLDRLKEALSYDPVTGHFTWLISINSRAIAGNIAGCKSDGYVIIKLDGVIYLAHRLAWLYMTGNWPANKVDHWDTDRSNNAWSNLREATNAQNLHNRGRQRNNTSGFKGVSWCKRNQKWNAHIHFNNRQKNLGYFDNPKEAHEVYCLAANLLHGEFANTGA